MVSAVVGWEQSRTAYADKNVIRAMKNDVGADIRQRRRTRFALRQDRSTRPRRGTMLHTLDSTRAGRHTPPAELVHTVAQGMQMLAQGTRDMETLANKKNRQIQTVPGIFRERCWRSPSFHRIR
jgi:hypothetical protein